MSTDPQDIDLLAELDNVSKIHTMERSTIDDVMLIMAKKIVEILKIERISVWLLNNEEDALISMGEYDTRSNQFQKNNVLKRADFEDYFKAIEDHKLIYAPDPHQHPATYCLSDHYLTPNDVNTMVDIPMRREGKLIGVMCYEKTGKKRKAFTKKECEFAYSVALIISSNLEARYRRTVQHLLEKSIREKELLIKEMNHRVKNNFSILISLLRISKEQGNEQSPKVLLEEYQQRIMSMMKIHDLLFSTGNYNEIDLLSYLKELVKEFKSSHPELANNIKTDFSSISNLQSSRNGLYLGLLITETFLNAIKHAQQKPSDLVYTLAFYQNEDQSLVLDISDNGKGFDFKEAALKTSMGLSLIEDIVNDLDLNAQFPTKGDSRYRFTFV